jgi:hypothetical protein
MHCDEPKLESVAVEDKMIELHWSGGLHTRLHPIWLQWVQIERGDFHSSLRILADRPGQPRDARPLMKGAYGKSANGGQP